MARPLLFLVSVVGVVFVNLHSTFGQSSVQQLLALPMSSAELGEVMQMGMISLKLAHYRNQLLYFFVPESMVLLTIHCNKEHSIGGWAWFRET